ncbi:MULTISPECIES: hypothetical protein [Glutamicibacter]|uniref:PH domain-containing protein n=2 Tax=Glutamicibacter creatinolyticus TaxID=162496 RepID=A0A5B7WP64_9MICC|nr:MULTISPECIES: hypothetical protein [Glutamicibacter]QCY45871.1 hypothetical protein GcLGCM259_0078 [Glutamicibacter creatinolyticus]TLK57294.1 hypothetical protein FDN03_00640 [Glutamicibacter sp. V16R2B1]
MTSAHPTVLLCRQRPPRWLRRGGGVLLLLVAAGLAAGTATAGLPALLGAGFFALAGIWWAFAARISARLDAHTLTLAAPLWRRRLPREQISQVRVEPDSGLNPGLLNWPVLRTGGLIRLNMGGRTAVSFSAGGRRYQFVLDRPQLARQLAQALRG